MCREIDHRESQTPPISIVLMPTVSPVVRPWTRTMRSLMSMWRECPLLDSTQSKDGAECGSKLVGVDGQHCHPVRGVDSSYGSHMQISSRLDGGVIPHHGGDPVTSESRGPSAMIMTQTIHTTAPSPVLTDSGSGSASSDHCQVG